MDKGDTETEFTIKVMSWYVIQTESFLFLYKIIVFIDN